MRARSLIDGASYGPDALKAMGLVFDAAWAHIAGNFGSDPSAARLTLADALLSVADDKSRYVKSLLPRCKEWRWTTDHFVAQDAVVNSAGSEARGPTAEKVAPPQHARWRLGVPFSYP
jgi:hypothetical protein